ncbi:odorant receptor 2a-like [Aethina tumida]|uniref:odorant receptor 2a-like n=1 Tax=Aethina tumida TaxID=116153 RepID=UPI002148C7E3|nr:odorant receptor 2a-like [Aethina tumida]
MSDGQCALGAANVVAGVESEFANASGGRAVGRWLVAPACRDPRVAAKSFFRVLYLITQAGHDFLKISNTVFIVVEFIIVTFKQSVMKMSLSKFTSTWNMVDSEMFNLHKPNQVHILRNTTDKCSKLSKAFVTIYTVCVANWALVPYITPERSLQTGIWLPFNPLDDLKSYVAATTYISISCLHASYFTASIDTLSAGLIMQAVGQLELLNDNLKNLHKCAQTDDPDAVYKKIIECVKHNEYIYKYVKEVEECLSIIIFAQFLTSTIVICMTCVILTLVSTILTQKIIVLARGLFFYCYYGTLLYQESNNVIDAIYSGEWYELDEKCKRALVVLMVRAQKPFLLSAGKFFTVSLETFTVVLRRAYSLFAVLNNY